MYSHAAFLYRVFTDRHVTRRLLLTHVLDYNNVYMPVLQKSRLRVKTLALREVSHESFESLYDVHKDFIVSWNNVLWYR